MGKIEGVRKIDRAREIEKIEREIEWIEREIEWIERELE